MAGFTGFNLNSFNNNNQVQQQAPKPVAIDPLQEDRYLMIQATLSHPKGWKAGSLGQFHNGSFPKVVRKQDGGYIFNITPLPMARDKDGVYEFQADGSPKYGAASYGWYMKRRNGNIDPQVKGLILGQVSALGEEAAKSLWLAYNPGNPDAEAIFNEAIAPQWEKTQINWKTFWDTMGYEGMEVKLINSIPGNFIDTLISIKEQCADLDTGNYSIRLWFSLDNFNIIKEVQAKKVYGEDKLPVELYSTSGEVVLQKSVKPRLVHVELVKEVTYIADPSKCISPDLMMSALEAATKSATVVKYADHDIAARKREQLLACPKKKWALHTGYLDENANPMGCEFFQLAKEDKETFEMWAEALHSAIDRKIHPSNKNYKVSLEWVEWLIECARKGEMSEAPIVKEQESTKEDNTFKVEAEAEAVAEKSTFAFSID